MNKVSENPIRLSWWKRIMPPLFLFFLAPFVGEYLLGNLKFSELGLLPFLALLYGAGAILIREITRRTGKGIATMLGLGVAYALIEEGLVDQMLFNADYFTGQQELMNTVISTFGLDVWLVIIVTAMHTIWSILIPILIVEGIFQKRGIRRPWLNKTGLGIVAVIFVLGSAWLSQQIYLETKFWATPVQLFWISVIGTAIIAATFMIKRRDTTAAKSFVPHPWILGCVAFAASSLFMLTEYLYAWYRVIGCIVITVVFFVAVYQWSQRKSWNAIHTYSLVGGAILMYAWLGAVMVPETGPKTLIDHIGTVLFIFCALGVFSMAFRKVQHSTSK